MNRKYGSDYDLYKMARKNVGKKGTSKEMAKLFGFHKKTYIYKSRLYKFLEHAEYKHPKSYWIVPDLIAIPRDGLFDLNIPIRVTRYTGTFVHHGTKYFLIRSEHVPFWAMKEYGGKY